jgi:agmatine/peptidylarginine deiminase
MKTIALLPALLVSAAVAQNLPKGLTEAEKAILPDYYRNYSVQSNRGITTPPVGSIRCAAEWEEIQTLVITWTGQYNGIQSQIVDAAQEECRVLVVCNDSTAVKTQLTNRGVPHTNVSFIEGPFNSVWIRDYAANTMYFNDVDDLFLVDWIYNRPRPDDDVMPDLHAQFHNIDLYTTTVAPTDLVNTGGNWMSDGFGTAFASELIIEENEPGNPYSVTAKTEPQIDAIMSDFMGITRYIKMPVLPYDGIHHIDMHMKLIDEETLLVSEYPTGVADGPQIEANLQYVLSTFNSMYGTPYRVVRITVPPSTGGAYPDNGGYYRTYSNNVFINGTVLVPYYRAEYDTIAERTLKEALPGYKIIGIDVDNSGENLISSSGAIHCITHSIGVEDPMLISHQRLDDTYDDQNPYLVDAFIKHTSGIASATLYWTTDTTAGYAPVAMTAAGSDHYHGYIPAQPVGTRIFYYVQGTAVSGKVQVRPIVAPTGYWMFRVLGPTNVNELPQQGVVLSEPFPNPAKAITCVPVNLEAALSGRVYITDVTGRFVAELFNGTLPRGESKYFFNAGEFAPGSYHVVVETDAVRVAKSVIISH